MSWMVQRFFDIIRHFFSANKRKRCTVIEQVEEGVRTIDALIDEEEKKLEITHKRHYSSFDEIRKFFLRRDFIVLALSGDFSTTIEGSMVVPRENGTEQISEEELEQLIFKGFWGFLNEHRAWTAKKMETTDVDLVLANIEVAEITLGKFNVVNPIGLKGKNLRIRFRGTFVPRALLPVIAMLRERTNELYVMEADAALSSFLTDEKGIALFCKTDYATVFSVSAEGHRYLRKIPWNLSGLFEKIQNDFGTEEGVAQELFACYARNGVSPRIEIRMEKYMRDAFSDLFSLFLKSEGRRLARFPRLPIHINCYFHMPNSDKWLTMKKRTELHSLDQRIKKLGISISDTKKNTRISFSTTLLFFYPTSYPKHEFLDQMLRRRAKWLIAYT